MMKIKFKAKNGFCPEWVHDGISYYLFEDYDGTWTLMSQKVGVLKKDRFYGEGPKSIHPATVLERFFRGKENVQHERRGRLSLWFWDGKQFATDGKIIVMRYQSKYERPSFGTYLECLRDAKGYLSQKYDDKQLSLFD